MLQRLPLRLLLTLPYAVLVLALAATVGGLSYHAADQTIESMAAKLHLSTGERIQETTRAYLSNWQYVLAAAQGEEPAMDDVERRLWHAGALSSVRPSYVYFAAPDGRFVGVQRDDDATTPALLKLRAQPGARPRQLFNPREPADRTQPLADEEQAFIATERPWYIAAEGAPGDVWSPVYRDFSTGVPMVTLARAVRDGKRILNGVYGADVPLAQLESFLKRLAIVQQGLAYIVTRDGRIIASSIGGDAGAMLLPAASSSDATLAASFRAIAPRLLSERGRGDGTEAGTVSRFDAGAHTLLVSAAPLREHASLDWWVVVALREDLLMAGITRNALRTALLSGLAALAALALGAAVLRSLLGEVRALTRAAEQLSADQSPAPLRTARRDELGRLSNAFDQMAERLNASTRIVRRQHADLRQTVTQLGAEMRARDSAEQRLRGVTDAMSEGFVVIDRDWRISYANPVTATIPGVAMTDVVGQSVWDVYPPMAGTELEAALRRCAASGEAMTLETQIERAGVWLELRLFPSALGMAVFFSDVTRQHGQRAALAERQRQLQRLAGELLKSQAEERRSIARELHDEMGQQLAALRINLQVLRAQAGDAAQDARLGDSLAIVQQVIAQVRSRALDLHPAILDDLGLVAALQWMCERKAQRSGVAIRLHEATALPPIAPEAGLACYRIAQEAMLNALKHAQPTRIDLTIGAADGRLRLDISDDGTGFEGAAAPGQSLGLVSMRERAEQLGGTLAVHSQHNRGTRVEVTIPLALET